MRTSIAAPVVLVAALLLPAAAPAQETPRRHVVEPGASRLWVVTHREGLLSFLGHEHAILAEAWNADLCIAPAGSAEGSSARITIETERLVIDSDSARELAGLGDGPGEADVRQIQETLLDAEHLDAAGHPRIVVETADVSDGGGGELDVAADVTIRGVTRRVRFPARLVRLGEAVRLEGSVPILQSDFGIEPESIGGVVKVSDEVDLHFLVVARATGQGCGA